MSRTFRRFALTAVLTVAAALCAPALFAQRGPAPPPPPSNPGGPGGPGGIGPSINNGGMRLPNGPPNIPGGMVRGRSALGLPGRWWDDKHFIRQLNLRPEQQKNMDTTFEAHKAALANALQNLQRQRAQLSSLSQKDLQDENKVLASIDRVVAARADLARETTQVVSALRKELDQQQVAVLDKEIDKNRQ
jgi:Spy/CpxP family protein refolding chaperone